MAFDSCRDFIEKLDAMGELIRISEPVATELEITEWADREMKNLVEAKHCCLKSHRGWTHLSFPSGDQYDGFRSSDGLVDGGRVGRIGGSGSRDPHEGQAPHQLARNHEVARDGHGSASCASQESSIGALQGGDSPIECPRKPFYCLA